jgi:pimeloyl-ACP methyl ester carboxylesterase
MLLVAGAAKGVLVAVCKLNDAEAIARARIPVERIRAPVLTISGTDDGSWPSTRYAEMVEEALTAAKHP